MSKWTFDILLIAAELLLLTGVWLGVNRMATVIFRRLGAMGRMQRVESQMTALRRNVRGILFLLFAAGVVMVLAGNALLLYRGTSVYEYTRTLIADTPIRFWLSLLFGLVKVIVVVIVATFVVRGLQRIMHAGEAKAKAFEGIQTNDASIELFFTSLTRILSGSVWWLTLIYAARIMPLPAAVPQTLYLLLRIYLIVMLGLLIVKIAAVAVDSLDALSLKYSNPDNLLRFYDQLRGQVDIAALIRAIRQPAPVL